MRLNEMVGQLMPYDESTAMRLAKDLYRGSGGDVEKARRMLRYFANQVSGNLDKYDRQIRMKRVKGQKMDNSNIY
jgi:hypothetical protein